MAGMNERVKRLWVEALTSDDYQQNFYQDQDGSIPLRTEDNRWSIFGVLCNLHAQEFKEHVTDEIDPTCYLGYEVLTPESVRSWAGLTALNTVFSEPVDFMGAKFHTLRDLSENGAPFFFIAGVIEARL